MLYIGNVFEGLLMGWGYLMVLYRKYFCIVIVEIMLKFCMRGNVFSLVLGKRGFLLLKRD